MFQPVKPRVPVDCHLQPLSTTLDLACASDMTDPATDQHLVTGLRSRRFSQAATAAGPLRNGQSISSHALLLEVDLRLAYCAGAWLAVIVLACAAIEAQARQVTASDYSSPVRDLFAHDPNLQWLRKLRNELMHAAEPGTASQLWKVAGGDIGANQRELEAEATRGVELMFQAIYGRNPKDRREA